MWLVKREKYVYDKTNKFNNKINQFFHLSNYQILFRLKSQQQRQPQKGKSCYEQIKRTWNQECILGYRMLRNHLRMPLHFWFGNSIHFEDGNSKSHPINLWGTIFKVV